MVSKDKGFLPRAQTLFRKVINISKVFLPLRPKSISNNVDKTNAQLLGTEKIGKLLKTYAFPAIIAMTASSLYNIIDSIFIGQGVGPMAISGLAITFPIMNLSAAFGTLVGAGAAALISILLGQRNYEVANKVLGNVMTLNTIIGVLFTIVTLSLLDPILEFFGASENTLPYARDYMRINLLGNAITHLYFGLNAVLRSSGHPKRAMAATILTVALNAALDPIFIFGLDMGVQGAAIATVLAQTVSLIWLLSIFANKKEVLHFRKGVFSWDSRIARESLSIGLAPFLMNVASCFVVLLINQRLKTYGGDLAIGAYGIVNRISFIFLMVVMGLNQGMQPIAGYNYGAGQFSRVMEVLRTTIFWASAVTIVGFLLGMLCPSTLVSAFTSDAELKEIASRGLRLMIIAFPVVGFQVVVSNFFQSLGMANKAIFMSLSRQLLFLIPFLIIMPPLLGTDGVWLSMPMADGVSAIIAGFMLAGFMRKLKKGEIKTKNIE